MRHLCLSLILLLLSLPLGGCSKGTLSLNVDILSFFEENDRTITYGEDPVIPGYGPEVSVKSPIQAVPIAEELSLNGTIERLFFRVGIDIENLTGEAEAEFRLYACEAGLDPFLSPAFLVQDVAIAPDTSYTLDILVEGDDRLMQLFNKDEIYFAVELFLHPGQVEDGIRGELLMKEFFSKVTIASSL